MENNFLFGYPQSCVRCAAFSSDAIELRVIPHYKPGGNLRVMLIGQDPTITKGPERVKEVLMLNQPNGSLSRWLKEILGADHFHAATLYATNLVKCSFMKPPSHAVEGGFKFLKPYFDHCKEHLANELLSFQPNCVLTLGEPAHRLFITILDNHAELPETMQAAFTGQFLRAKFRGIEFDYSPCLHIQTFRVAETYGERVQKFKKGISAYFQTTNNTDAE